MSYPYGTGNLALAQKKEQKPAEGSMKVVRDSKAFTVDWHIEPTEDKPGLTLVRGRGDEKKPQVSNTFTREKKDEPAQLPSETFFG